MNDESINQVPAFEPPGAGLPPVEAFLGRHVLFPFFAATHPWDKAIELFREEGSRILHLSVHLTPEQLTRRIVIPRLPGLEDSSRYWSVAMTLDHLCIVGSRIRDGIVLLSKDVVPPEKVDTAAVKPDENAGIEAIAAFRKSIDDYTWSLQEKVLNRHSRATYVHPWFGPLTAGKWCALGALHQQLHRRQIEAIIKRL